MDISFIWSLRPCSLIAAVQMILWHKESIMGHILGVLQEAFTHTLPLWPCCHLRCDSALDAALTPEAFTNKMQSILGVLFMCFAFLRVQLEVWIPILPWKALSSGVSTGWLSVQANLPKPTLPGRAQEWATLSAASHQAGRGCHRWGPAEGGARACRKAGSQRAGEEVWYKSTQK